jgi:hypothetical protein
MKLSHPAVHALFFVFQQSDYKVINKDQWCNVLEFCRTVKSDLSNYDVDGACKLIDCFSGTSDLVKIMFKFCLESKRQRILSSFTFITRKEI